MSSSRTRGAPWEWASLVLVSVFVFLRALRLPPLVSTGVDGSWQLALTEAHLAGLAFGRDIVFTYGPLGYLVAGSAVWSAYRGMVAFAFALAALCALAVAINLTGRASFAVKCAFVIAIAFAVTEAWTPDVFLLSLMLLWVSPWTRAARGSAPAVAIGFLSGLALLVKFNLGIAAVAGGLAVFALPGFPPRLNTARALAFLVAVVVASGASFAYAKSGVLVSLALAAVAAAALLARDRASGVPSSIFAAVAVLCAIAVAILPAYGEYLQYSLQIASGYSSAMMIEGPSWQLVLAFGVLAVVALILAGNVRTLGLGVALALALVAFLEFKEGFVRQDGHVIFTFWAAFSIVALVIPSSASSRLLRVNGAAAALLLGAWWFVVRYEPFPSPVVKALNPFTLPTDAANVAALWTDGSAVRQSFSDDLTADRLPTQIVSRIGRSAVDAWPAETAEIFANGLSWKPTPVFQGYSAYTSALDGLDARHVETSGAEYELFDWTTIDGRYPLWDQPAATLALLCNYAVADVNGTYFRSQARKSLCYAERHDAVDRAICCKNKRLTGTNRWKSQEAAVSQFCRSTCG